jgi:uncharacterized radical SAM superfamily protein
MHISIEDILTETMNPPVNWVIFRRILKLNDPEELKLLFEHVEKNLFSKFPSSKLIKTFIPGSTFPAVSITGHQCELKCEHCKGEYLKGMIPINSPEEFIPKLTEAMKKGAKGFLISGGCNNKGELPYEKYKDIIKQFRQTTGAILNAHPGLMDFTSAFYLENIGVDFISFDFVADDEVIHDIFHLKKRETDDYMETYYNLLDTRIDVIPHILIGAKYGKIDREGEVFKMLEEEQTSNVVFISMIPPKGDSKFSLPEITDVAKFILATRLKFPNIEISLGCMRVRGKGEFQGFNLEQLAVLCGADRIAMPSRGLINWAKEKSIKIESYNSCCAIPARFLSMFKSFDEKSNGSE